MPSLSNKITILDVFAALSTILIGVVGYLNSANQNLIINGQTRMANTQEAMQKELSNTNSLLRVNMNQISNLKDELSEVKTTQKKFANDVLIRVDGISKRVYKLEGAN